MRMARFLRRPSPPPAPLTPAEVPRGDRVTDKPGAWDHLTWAALGFSMSHEHYFSFAFDSENQASLATFRARAHGDLDGDGERSTFELGGEMRAGQKARVLPGLYVDREVELGAPRSGRARPTCHASSATAASASTDPRRSRWTETWVATTVWVPAGTGTARNPGSTRRTGTGWPSTVTRQDGNVAARRTTWSGPGATTLASVSARLARALCHDRSIDETWLVDRGTCQLLRPRRDQLDERRGHVEPVLAYGRGDRVAELRVRAAPARPQTANAGEHESRPRAPRGRRHRRSRRASAPGRAARSRGGASTGCRATRRGPRFRRCAVAPRGESDPVQPHVRSRGGRHAHRHRARELEAGAVGALRQRPRVVVPESTSLERPEPATHDGRVEPLRCRLPARAASRGLREARPPAHAAAGAGRPTRPRAPRRAPAPRGGRANPTRPAPRRARAARTRRQRPRRRARVN